MAQHLISPTVAMNITGIDGLEACWALDRFTHPQLGLTRVGLLLGRAKVAGLGPAGVALAERVAEVASRQRLPPDIVVVAVPSASHLSRQMAECVSSTFERPMIQVLAARGGLFGRFDGNVGGRIRVRTRRAPKHVLLVDDSVHTGATLARCAELLRQRGTQQVWAVVAAAMLDAEVAEVAKTG
jgi:hypothetical protein